MCSCNSRIRGRSSRTLRRSPDVPHDARPIYAAFVEPSRADGAHIRIVCNAIGRAGAPIADSPRVCVGTGMAKLREMLTDGTAGHWTTLDEDDDDEDEYTT